MNRLLVIAGALALSGCCCRGTGRRDAVVVMRETPSIRAPEASSQEPERAAEPTDDAERLVRMLASDDADVRVKGLTGLRALGAPAREHLPEIVELAMDPSERVRLEVVLTVAALYCKGDDPSFTALTHIEMSDGSRQNRLAAHRATQTIVGGSVARLREAVDDPEQRARVEEGLVQTESLFPVDVLVGAEWEMRDEPPLYQIDAALLLARFGERGVAVALRLLAECLDASDGQDRADAARAVGTIGPAAAPLLEVLDGIATDEEERQELREAAREAAALVRAE